MKHVFHIFALAVLVAVVTGCGGTHRYDGRLVAADSLMWTAPDSALATLAAIDSLAGEANQAYRDLLMTQARYKCYADITASDDSAITRAMGYYRAHSSECEKLTRAFLYKGAVMEELGHVDSAMYYYKTAEATADTTDYLNLGQINTRIAYLYNKFYADEQTSYEKYQLAYKNYLMSGNKDLQLNSLFKLFMLDGITKQQQHQAHEELYKKAISLANDLEDYQMLFDLYELKCRQLSQEDSTCQEAKQLALKCLKDYKEYVNNDLLLDLAYVYAKEHQLDSANYFIKDVDETMNPSAEQRINVRKYDILSMIARSEGNPLISSQYQEKGSILSDSILNNKDKYDITKIENSFNSNQYKSSQSKIKYLRWTVLSVSLIAIIIIALLSAAYLHRLQRTKAIINELNNSDQNRQINLLGQLEDKSVIIERLLSNLVEIIKLCTRNNAKNSTSHLAQQIKETIVNVVNEDFWNELRALLDKQHHGLISNLVQTHNLNEKDLKFIELTCSGFNYVEMAIIMDYSPRYILNKRKILAKKMGLDMPLQEYLNGLMTQNR